MAKKKTDRKASGRRGPKEREPYTREEIQEMADGFRDRAAELDKLVESMQAVPLEKLEMKNRESIQKAVMFFKQMTRTAVETLEKETPLEKRRFR